MTTLDIDPALKPDITGSVLSIPLGDKAFDAVGCFEVLEHLPYEEFPKALSEIRRVCSGRAVLSVPDHTPIYRFNIELPLIGRKRRPGEASIGDENHQWPTCLVHDHQT